MTAPTKGYDPIQEFLRQRGQPSHVVKAGFKGLVLNWEKVVAELVFDGYRYGLRDFVNDLDRRVVLAGALAVLGDEAPRDLVARVEAADGKFRGATWVASRCLLVDEEVAERGLSREVDWYFYRVPRRHRGNFAKDLQEGGIAPLDPAAPPEQT